ncbi:MAG: xanthine dehydrogenase family protein molybdopterin-binding subunit [Candidatus Tectimicrobiota bacterium]
MRPYEPNMVLSTQEYNVVGKRPVRHDGADKVTGKARYGADITLPGMLYGKVLRSPHAHARITSINTSKAEAYPGVRAVITSADMQKPSGRASELAEGAMVNFRFLSNNLLAEDKVLYKGHAVAAVAAASIHVAEEALKLIEVEYEVLPPVLTAEDAMQPGAPLLHERLAAMHTSRTRAGGVLDEDDASAGTNIANHFDFRLGDVEQGFQEAEIIVEKEVATVAVHQGYIEPHCGTAMWHEDGNLTVWSSSQGHFMVRDYTSRLVGIPVSKVTAIPMEIGGGFGAKLTVYMEPLAALLAKKAGAPVKVAMSRTEVFEATGPTSGTKIRVKLGATKDGRLTAASARLIFEAGAFPGSPVPGGAQCMMSAYDIPNAYIEGFDVVVNRPKSAAYRAPGSPAAAFAMETAIDELCEKLGMDPIEFRLLNSSKEGVRRATGPLMPKVGFIEVLEAAKNHPHYDTPLAGPYRGRGVASGFWGNNSGPSSAVALVLPDGTVSLTEGSPDIGGTRTSVSQQLAEVLGIPIEEVKPHIADTDSIGFTSNTGGSGVTFKTGMAAYTAAQDIKRQMLERVAKVWEVSPEDLEYVNGGVQQKSNPAQRMTFKQIAARQIPTGGPIVGAAGVNPPGPGPALATHIVDLEVDPETGKVTILRYTAIQDVGKAIHPSYVEGQIQGAVAQGIGWALHEEYFMNDQGHMLNASYLDYRMPTTLDVPMLDTVLVEVANPTHPFGVRGVGEVCIVPPLAAISNALYQAIGVRLNRLPMNPGVILEALASKKGQ